MDLLEAKLKFSPLDKLFPNIPKGKESDLEFATSFFQGLFEDKLVNSHVEEIFFHTTCAIDTKSFAKLYTSLRESVIGGNFDAVGL